MKTTHRAAQSPVRLQASRNVNMRILPDQCANGKDSRTVHQAATAYLSGGTSILPIRRDGSKAPALTAWKWLESELPTADRWSSVETA